MIQTETQNQWSNTQIQIKNQQNKYQIKNYPVSSCIQDVEIICTSISSQKKTITSAWNLSIYSTMNKWIVGPNMSIAYTPWLLFFWYDAKSYLFQMGNHNNWSNTQIQIKNQWNKYQTTKLSSFNLYSGCINNSHLKLTPWINP